MNFKFFSRKNILSVKMLTELKLKKFNKCGILIHPKFRKQCFFFVFHRLFL